METLSAHQEMMLNLFLAARMMYSDSENIQQEGNKHFQKGLDILQSGQVDPFAEDNQLLREIKVRRWKENECNVLSIALLKLTKSA